MSITTALIGAGGRIAATITVAGLVALASSPARAHQNTLGYGANACSLLVSTYEPRQMMTIFAWAAGFFTGSNMASIASQHRDRDLTDLTPAFVVTRILDYCRQHPEDPVLRAVEQVYLSMPLAALKR